MLGYICSSFRTKPGSERTRLILLKLLTEASDMQLRKSERKRKVKRNRMLRSETTAKISMNRNQKLQKRYAIKSQRYDKFVNRNVLK